MFKNVFPSTKITQNIDISSPESVSVGDLTVINAKSTSGLIVTVKSTTPKICLLNDTKLNLISGGVCKLTATQSGSNNFIAAKPVSVNINVKKLDQKITYKAPISLVIGNSFNLEAISTSGLVVLIKNKTTNLCKISGYKITAVKVGTCNLQLTQIGDKKFNSAQEINLSIRINYTADIIKKKQVITSSPLTSLIVNHSIPINAVSSSGLALDYKANTPTVCSLDNSGILTGLQAGVCSVTVTQSGNSYYEAADPVTIFSNVEKSSQKITFDSLNDNLISLGYIKAKSSSGLEVKYSSLTPDFCSVTNNDDSGLLGAKYTQLKSAVSCNIAVNQEGNDTYSAATQVTYTFKLPSFYKKSLIRGRYVMKGRFQNKPNLSIHNGSLENGNWTFFDDAHSQREVRIKFHDKFGFQEVISMNDGVRLSFRYISNERVEVRLYDDDKFILGTVAYKIGGVCSMGLLTTEDFISYNNLQEVELCDPTTKIFDNQYIYVVKSVVAQFLSVVLPRFSYASDDCGIDSDSDLCLNNSFVKKFYKDILGETYPYPFKIVFKGAEKIEKKLNNLNKNIQQIKDSYERIRQSLTASEDALNSDTISNADINQNTLTDYDYLESVEAETTYSQKRHVSPKTNAADGTQCFSNGMSEMGVIKNNICVSNSSEITDIQMWSNKENPSKKEIQISGKNLGNSSSVSIETSGCTSSNGRGNDSIRIYNCDQNDTTKDMTVKVNTDITPLEDTGGDGKQKSKSYTFSNGNGSGNGSIYTCKSSITGYCCGTTKKAFDADWIQSHASYWAAMNYHDKGLYNLERQYCEYAQPTCEQIAKNVSDCPG